MNSRFNLVIMLQTSLYVPSAHFSYSINVLINIGRKRGLVSSSIRFINTNIIAVADSLVKTYPNSIIFGDYARALVSDSFCASDKLILITDNSDMVIDACVRLRTKIGLFRNTRDFKADNSIKADIVCAAVEEDPEFEELMDSDDLGFLTADEWKTIKAVPHIKNTIRNIQEPCVPELAKVVWSVSCRDLQGSDYNMFLHVVRPGVDTEKYAIELAKTVNKTISANLVYIKNDIPYQGYPGSLEDLKNRVIVPVRAASVPALIATSLRSDGWSLSPGKVGGKSIA